MPDVTVLPVLTAAAGAVAGGLSPWMATRHDPADRPAPNPGPGVVAVAAAVGAVVFAGLAHRFGTTPQLLAYAVLAGVSLVLTIVDLRHHLLPNALVVPTLGIGLALLADQAMR